MDDTTIVDGVEDDGTVPQAEQEAYTPPEPPAWLVAAAEIADGTELDPQVRAQLTKMWGL